MRLLKYLALLLAGYAAYELYQGLMGRRSARAQLKASRDLDRSMDESSGRMGTLTGPGIGELVSTADSDGASARHLVGRGVVHT